MSKQLTAKERAANMVEEWAKLPVRDMGKFFERHLNEHAAELAAERDRLAAEIAALKTRYDELHDQRFAEARKADALAAENAELREVLESTPMIGRMAAIVYSVVGDDKPTQEQREIGEWLDARRKALGGEQA